MKNPILLVTFACFLYSTSPDAAAEPVRPRVERVFPSGASTGLSDRRTVAKRLATAVEMLKRGEASAASRVLEAVIKGPSVAGVTDEALLRLALLSIKAGAEGAGAGQDLRLLKRLKKEFPRSQWTLQAGPLMELITDAEELRRQNKALKAANQTLTTEKESLKKKAEEVEGKLQQVNKNLEQLKRLDLELEQKAR